MRQASTYGAQSYKSSKVVNYYSRVEFWSNFLVIITLGRVFICYWRGLSIAMTSKQC